MSARDVPEWLVQALAQRLEATPREPLRQAQQHLSDVYRASGHSNVAIRTAADALAYALVRMPATYAACATVLDRLAETAPDFHPSTVLDIGAGPGTATFAVGAHWPTCTAMRMVEPHPVMARLASELAAGDAAERVCPPIEAVTLDRLTDRFDLVIASYVLTEQDERSTTALVETAWRLTTGVLVLVEPGTRHGYRRLMAARTCLIGLGGSVVAPCPGHVDCPLGADDWCHFKVRLNRRKEHRLIKGADAPFEDEPYNYLIVARPGIAARPGHARILRVPTVGKAGIDVTLCTSDGLAERTIPRRSKAAYKAAKRWTAGDAVPLEIVSKPSLITDEEPRR